MDQFEEISHLRKLVARYEAEILATAEALGTAHSSRSLEIDAEGVRKRAENAEAAARELAGHLKSLYGIVLAREAGDPNLFPDLAKTMYAIRQAMEDPKLASYLAE